ncbi:unnamed protein product [Phyllotreta striolata]|uniref:folate gamma-glutamyl hydrolase n=1 Tax=Phyllotreta striolata TaxID=444603 RepID=A0A9N9TN99_PHYSR|nr:unnamed protein product [Phyllotreta striolata]
MFKFLINVLPILGLVIGNETPIIGILSQPDYDYGYDTVIAASYVKYLESAGARVLPIWINQTVDYYERVVQYTNGVLFPGGSANFTLPGGYGETARTLYKLAKEANDKNEHYPIWGTCLGFEVLPYAQTGTDAVVTCSVPHGSFTLDFKGDYRNSRLYSPLPLELLDVLTGENVTYNSHHFCLTESGLARRGIASDWHVLSTNTDAAGLKFISSMEHREYPFYGTQFHPEKNNFEFKPDEGFAHSLRSVLVSQYFADFFVSEARKNDHRFPDRSLESRSLIYNYCPKFTGKENDYYYQVYGFEREDYARNNLL